MSTSEVAICNSALAKVGAGRILSLDDNNDRAKLLKEQYYKVRDELLYSHPWNFATARASLAPSADTPLFDWDYQFPLPSDVLRVYGTDLAKTDEWTVEGRNLMCNYDTVQIKYIKLVTDVNKFTPGFAEVLACKLAADIAYSITQSASLSDMLYKAYEKKLREVRTFDAQEGAGDRVYADSWLNSRA